MDSNLTVLAYQRETAFGVVAAPLALKRLRFTKETLEHDKQTEVSAEIRDDRQEGEIVEVGVNGTGGFDFELAAADFDEFLESAFGAAFTAVGGVPTLRPGTARTSYVFEKKLLTGAFALFTGQSLDTLSLNLDAKKIITGTMGFIGRGATITTVTSDTAGGYTAAGTGLILSASSNVANILENGAALAKVKSLKFNVKNNLRANDVIARKDADSVGIGASNFSGHIEAYFNDVALLQRFIDHTPTSLSFEVSRTPAGAATGDTIGYRFTVPRLKYMKGFPTVPGKNQDLMIPLDWQAEAGPLGYLAQVEKLLAP